MSNTSLQSNSIPAFLKNLKRYSGRYLQLAVVLGILSGFLLVVQAWLLANTVNAVVFEEATLADTALWLGLMLPVFLLRAFLVWASELTAFHAAAKIKLEMRQLLYKKIRQLGPAYLGDERSGEITTTLSEGVETLENYFARYLPAVSMMMLVPLAILIFIFPTDWISGAILLVTAPLIPLFMILIGKGAEHLNQKQWRKLARMSAHFLDVIQGLTTLKLFNASKREAETVKQISEEYRQHTMAVLRVAFLSSLALEFFATISIALVAVIIGFRLFWGDIQLLQGFFILLLAPEFYLPLRNMGTHYHTRMEAIGAAEKMIQLLNTEDPQPGKKILEPLEKTASVQIQLDNISYSYGASSPALKNINLTIKSGEKIAIVGSSGSGKSTLVKLLLGFIHPQQGSININGQPLDELNPDDWLKHCAWVPQSPRLFQGTIRENIQLGKSSASLEEIRTAAINARADEFISALPDGYESRIGEQGKGLSGGQIQRIALARAFLKDAPLIIFDEATNSLDRTNEQLVSAAINTLSQNRTTIMIAHRLETVKNADRIIVLQNGKIAEQGDHEKLLALKGRYHELVFATGNVA